MKKLGGQVMAKSKHDQIAEGLVREGNRGDG